MTFEEWWGKNISQITNKYHYINLNLFIIENNDLPDLLKTVWEAAQPKWKDAQKEPPKEAGSYLCIWNNGFYNVQQACMYDAKTKMFITNTLFPVIAWMPLPEATGNIDK